MPERPAEDAAWHHVAPFGRGQRGVHRRVPRLPEALRRQPRDAVVGPREHGHVSAEFAEAQAVQVLPAKEGHRVRRRALRRARGPAARLAHAHAAGGRQGGCDKGREAEVHPVHRHREPERGLPHRPAPERDRAPVPPDRQPGHGGGRVHGRRERAGPRGGGELPQRLRVLRPALLQGDRAAPGRAVHRDPEPDRVRSELLRLGRRGQRHGRRF
mmetsp:Transcript_60415/g.184575  ORF Transcript_60415/g.184575 Transcript_60415/m.184575 type:complete len:214 (+) Transcript_60415:68-709(+)